jgi:hypothetical protein
MGHPPMGMRPMSPRSAKVCQQAGYVEGQNVTIEYGALAIPVAWLALRKTRMGDRLLSGTGRSRPRWPAPLVEPGAVFAHLLALRCRRVALAG